MIMVVGNHRVHDTRRYGFGDSLRQMTVFLNALLICPRLLYVGLFLLPLLLALL
jgi:hypothetical protein